VDTACVHILGWSLGGAGLLDASDLEVVLPADKRYVGDWSLNGMEYKELRFSIVPATTSPKYTPRIHRTS